MKPREFWIDKQDWEAFDEDPYVECYHVIEKSAYDRLEAMCKKLADELDYVIRCVPSADRHTSKLLAEYRAMRDETKMPCPRNK